MKLFTMAQLHKSFSISFQINGKLTFLLFVCYKRKDYFVWWIHRFRQIELNFIKRKRKKIVEKIAIWLKNTENFTQTNIFPNWLSPIIFFCQNNFLIRAKIWFRASFYFVCVYIKRVPFLVIWNAWNSLAHSVFIKRKINRHSFKNQYWTRDCFVSQDIVTKSFCDKSINFL